MTAQRKVTIITGIVLMSFLASRPAPTERQLYTLISILAIICAIVCSVFLFVSLRRNPIEIRISDLFRQRQSAMVYPIEDVWHFPTLRSTRKLRAGFIPPSHVITLSNGKFMDARTREQWMPPASAYQN